MTPFSIAASLTLMLLVVAVIALFAMMGELAARVGERSSGEDTTAVPVDGARIGAEPPLWPDGIAHIGAVRTGVVLTLSPLCSACNRIAATVAGHPALQQPDTATALVVACSSTESGTEFLRQHNLIDVLPSALDVNGEWLAGQLGVSVSPTALVFRDGRLATAANIGSLAAITAITQQIQSTEEENEEPLLANAPGRRNGDR